MVALAVRRIHENRTISANPIRSSKPSKEIIATTIPFCIVKNGTLTVVKRP